MKRGYEDKLSNEYGTAGTENKALGVKSVTVAFCCVLSDNGTGACPSTSVFPCQ
jgi:hypothetical protein